MTKTTNKVDLAELKATIQALSKVKFNLAGLRVLRVYNFGYNLSVYLEISLRRKDVGKRTGLRLYKKPTSLRGKAKYGFTSLAKYRLPGGLRKRLGGYSVGEEITDAAIIEEVQKYFDGVVAEGFHPVLAFSSSVIITEEDKVAITHLGKRKVMASLRKAQKSTKGYYFAFLWDGEKSPWYLWVD